jgi:hypothetical protein
VVQTELALAEAGRGWTPTVLATFVIAALVGVVLVVVVDRFADGIEY